MSTRTEHLHYQRAVAAYLKADLRAFNRLSRSSSLSGTERSLLRARRLLRARKPAVAVRLLTSLPVATPGFLEAERAFLLGSAHFFCGEFEAAASANTDAVARYTALRDRRGLFLSHYNLSVDLARMGSARLSERHLLAAQNHAETLDEKALIARALACHFSARGDYESALTALNRALDDVAAHSLNDQAALYVTAGDVMFRAGYAEDALEQLGSARALGRRHREVGRVDFELTVLRSLQPGVALGPRPASVPPSSEFGQKWDLLRALQGGERERATALWRDLRAAAPGLYGAPFELETESERRSIFGVALARLVRPAAAGPLISVGIRDGKVGRLFMILKRSRTPLRREELIEAIWETAYDPAFDARFYKLMQRLKEVPGVRVECVNRAYRLTSGPQA